MKKLATDEHRDKPILKNFFVLKKKGRKIIRDYLLESVAIISFLFFVIFRGLKC